jgi:hypothetical protein
LIPLQNNSPDTLLWRVTYSTQITVRRLANCAILLKTAYFP